jgi:hypothetical protein
VINDFYSIRFTREKIKESIKLTRESYLQIQKVNSFWTIHFGQLIQKVIMSF